MGAPIPWRRVAAIATLLTLLTTGIAQASPAAAPGPPLNVPVAELAASVHCTASVAHSRSEPVLLVPGTALDPVANFSWNYERALSALGRPYCTVTLPEHATGDIQVAAEHVVYALRTMAALSHRKVEVLGYSQGGMVPRWALRFWPDTRVLVDDLVALDPSNHGTLDAAALCAASACAAGIWQQRPDSAFVAALNSGQQTFPGIDYTVVYSVLDEVVVPNGPPLPVSALPADGGRVANVGVNEVCPAHVADHLSIGTIDPVGYAVVLDAITHDGPVDPRRVDRSVCATLLMPGVDLRTLATDEAGFADTTATSLATAPLLLREPPLAPYASS